MSFILDALKKSEADQQRHTGPALFEVKVAPPKPHLPLWALVVGALLAINMVIVGWLLLRRPSHANETVAANNPTAAVPGRLYPTPAPPASTSAPTPALTAAPVPVPAPVAPGAGSPSVAAQSPPQPTPQQFNSAPSPAPTPSGYPRQVPTAPEQSASQQNAFQPRQPEREGNEPTLAGNLRQPGAAGNRDSGTTPPAGTRDSGAMGQAGGYAESGGNPDDYAPAADPNALAFKGHVKRGTESGLTLYQDAAVAPGANLPSLRLDLHVYAAKPQDRFALINMHKVREGDAVDGVQVESITPDGVVMSRNGSKFLLPRQ